MNAGQAADVRCVVVVDHGLAPGLAANAVGVLALTLGARLPGLVGPDLIDADGGQHPGLIAQGLPVLAAPGEALPALRARAAGMGLGVIGLPSAAQETTDYGAFRDRVAELTGDELAFLGLLVYGPRRAVSKVTGRLSLLGS